VHLDANHVAGVPQQRVLELPEAQLEEVCVLLFRYAGARAYPSSSIICSV